MRNSEESGENCWFQFPFWILFSFKKQHRVNGGLKTSIWYLVCLSCIYFVHTHDEDDREKEREKVVEKYTHQKILFSTTLDSHDGRTVVETREKRRKGHTFATFHIEP